MTAPSPKVRRLTRSMSRYDFSRKPLASTDIVIAKDGRVAKDRNGQAGRDATAEELAAAIETGPNR